MPILTADELAMPLGDFLRKLVKGEVGEDKMIVVEKAILAGHNERRLRAVAAKGKRLDITM